MFHTPLKPLENVGKLLQNPFTITPLCVSNTPEHSELREGLDLISKTAEEMTNFRFRV